MKAEATISCHCIINIGYVINSLIVQQYGQRY